MQTFRLPEIRPMIIPKKTNPTPGYVFNNLINHKSKQINTNTITETTTASKVTSARKTTTAKKPSSLTTTFKRIRKYPFKEEINNQTKRRRMPLTRAQLAAKAQEDARRAALEATRNDPETEENKDNNDEPATTTNNNKEKENTRNDENQEVLTAPQILALLGSSQEILESAAGDALIQLMERAEAVLDPANFCILESTLSAHQFRAWANYQRAQMAQLQQQTQQQQNQQQQQMQSQINRLTAQIAAQQAQTVKSTVKYEIYRK